MIPTTRVFFAFFFYITLCLAETDTYLQLITPATNVSVANVTNASLCNVVLNETDLDFDNTAGAYYYFIPNQGSYYFATTYIGPSPSTAGNDNDHDGGKSHGNDHDGGKSHGNDNDHDSGHKRSRRHYTNSHGGYGNDNDHNNHNTNVNTTVNTNNIANYVISPLNFTIGNVTYCVNITSKSSSSDNNNNNGGGNSHGNDNDHDGGKSHDNDHDGGKSQGNDNDHDGGKSQGNDNDHDGGKSHGNDNDHDGGKSNHHGGHGHGNDNDHNNANPTPNPSPSHVPTTVIIINVTIVNNTNNTVITTNTTTNDTSGNVDSNVTVIVVPSGSIINAIGNDPNNQFTDKWGNDARHAQIRDNLLNNRMQLENQLDNQIQGTNVERKTDVDITAQNNVIKLTSLFLFPQGASEDAKKNTCDALANSAESFSNITYTRDCDFTAMPQSNKRQAGDYVLISTYSDLKDTNGGMALTFSMFAILIAFLSYNF